MAEVWRRLQHEASVGTPPVRVMVVFTGGKLGLDISLQNLISLKKEKGLSYITLFSRSAANIHPVEEYRQLLGCEESYVEGKMGVGYASRTLQSCQGVVVPVLTRTTAARLSAVLLDSLAASIIADALMLGIPVVAASDAADPQGEGFTRLGMNKGRQAFVNKMKDNLQALTQFGVQLTTSSQLSPLLSHTLFPSQLSRENVVRDANPRIITLSDINDLVVVDGILRVSQNAILTPLVKDRIRELGWQLEIQ